MVRLGFWFFPVYHTELGFRTEQTRSRGQMTIPSVKATTTARSDGDGGDERRVAGTRRREGDGVKY